MNWAHVPQAFPIHCSFRVILQKTERSAAGHLFCVGAAPEEPRDPQHWSSELRPKSCDVHLELVDLAPTDPEDRSKLGPPA